MILVYEYASRGSLDRYLTNATTLTWTQRLKICVGVAQGLHFLHDPKSTQQRVLHRDIKSANILLDEKWTAKVSDFGLSKIGPANQAHTYLISHAVGTPGYCDPLYWELGYLSKESDVYSFGVVLFEILCGRLCYECCNHELSKILVHKWRQCYDEERLDEIILPGLKAQMDSGSLETFSAIAYQCVKKAHEDRPVVAEIVEKLEFSLIQQEIFEDAHKNSNRDRASFLFNGQADQSLDIGHHHNFERRFQDLVTDDYQEPPPVSDADDSYDLEDGPGIEGLMITGDPKPGRTLCGCGYAVRGTTTCMFQWARHYEDGTSEYIKGATNPEYVITADDVDKVIALECVPVDNQGRQGKVVRVFANDQKKISVASKKNYSKFQDLVTDDYQQPLPVSDADDSYDLEGMLGEEGLVPPGSNPDNPLVIPNMNGEELPAQTNNQTSFVTNVQQGMSGEEGIMMPGSAFKFVIIGLCILTAIKSQDESGFPFRSNPQTTMLAIYSVNTYGVASEVENGISAARPGPNSVYVLIAHLVKKLCVYVFIGALASLFIL